MSAHSSAAENTRGEQGGSPDAGHSARREGPPRSSAERARSVEEGGSADGMSAHSSAAGSTSRDLPRGHQGQDPLGQQTGSPEASTAPAGDKAPEMSVHAGVPVASASLHNGPHTTEEQTSRSTRAHTTPADHNMHADIMRRPCDALDMSIFGGVPVAVAVASATMHDSPHTTEEQAGRRSQANKQRATPNKDDLQRATAAHMDTPAHNGAGSSTDPPASPRRKLLPDLDRAANQSPITLAPLPTPTEHEKVLAACHLYLRVLYQDRAGRMQYRCNLDRAIHIKDELRDPANLNGLTAHTARACRRHDQAHETTFSILFQKALDNIYSSQPNQASAQAEQAATGDTAATAPPRRASQDTSGPEQATFFAKD